MDAGAQAAYLQWLEQVADQQIAAAAAAM